MDTDRDRGSLQPSELNELRSEEGKVSGCTLLLVGCGGHRAPACQGVACSPFRKMGGFYPFQKALSRSAGFGASLMAFAGALPRSQTHHFCPQSLQEGLHFAAVSRPAAASLGGSL